MKTVFEILEISPEATLREIKRAYAAKLKTCNQESEIARFQELRQAYELASRCALSRESEMADAAEEVEEPAPDQHSLSIQEVGDVSLLPDADLSEPLSAAACVMAALEREYADDPCLGAAEALQRYSSSEELVSLEERERFEQLLLVWLFASGPKIDFLDTATDMFAWETANQHLFEWRYDLALRVRNHLNLRHSILAVKGDADLIANGQYYYQICMESGRRFNEVVMPMTTLKGLSRLLHRIEALYPVETQERFSGELTFWKPQIKEHSGSLRADQSRANSGGQPGFQRSSAFFVLLVAFFLIRLATSNSNPIPQSKPPAALPSSLSTATRYDLPRANLCPLDENSLKQLIKLGVHIGETFAPECRDMARRLQVNSQPRDKPS